ncbi:MAG: hypothetical protein Kow0077_03900 [Anaerolineae bacterium]
MPKKDRHDNYDPYADFNDDDLPEPWEADDEESGEFLRRQQGAKRESAKRARALQKQMREERDPDFSANRARDKRAKEKETKRRYNELKRLAETLGIKSALQQLNAQTKTTCWGPDVISDKSRPSIGIVLNYVAEQAPNMASTLPALFGAWLYYQNQRVMIAVANRTPREDDSHVQQAQPPDREERIAEMVYEASDHDRVRSRVAETILNHAPIT